MTAPARAPRPPRQQAPAGCIIDASVTMPWFFADEATSFTEALLDTLADQPLWAPALWVLECANVLQSAQRRRRIDAPRRAAKPRGFERRRDARHAGAHHADVGFDGGRGSLCGFAEDAKHPPHCT